jgi:hypothetical protein
MSERREHSESRPEAAQLRLLPNREPHADWALDERTRRTGLKGVAAAREILRHARPPEPKQSAPVRKAS